jgi:hypothetical protein
MMMYRTRHQSAVETAARDDNNIRAQRTPGLGAPGFRFCPVPDLDPVNL